MRNLKNAFFIFLFCLASSHSMAIDTDPSYIENKVQNDLDKILSKILKTSQFSLQVSVQSDSVKEKMLVEGESFNQIQGTRKPIKVPPLPGFTITSSESESEPATPSIQNRQVFKDVEKNILKSVNVFVQVDDQISEEEFKQIRGIVNNYVVKSFGSKGKIDIAKAHLNASSNFADFWNQNKTFIWILIYSIIAICLGLFILSKIKKKNSSLPYSRLQNLENKEMEDDLLRDVTQPRLLLDSKNNYAEPPRHEVDLKKDKFLPIPENQKFASLRSKLIDLFLENSEVFRHYWKKISSDTKLELFSALRGPAFDSLLEVLELEGPDSGEINALPSEDQLEFYEKNFIEFMQTYKWQSSQFFGFLHLLTYQQVNTLVKGHNSLVAAFVVKYAKPEVSAQLLSEVSAQRRAEILQNLSRIAELSSDEMQSIEVSVRKSADLLPHFIWSKQMPEVDFWERVLSKSDNADEILMDLERTNAELYRKLSRFRFKLEDIPSLPPQIISEVFDKLNNDELSLALVDLSKDIQDFVLTCIPENRRNLIISQLISLTGIPRAEKLSAVKNVTSKFREAIL